MNLRQLFVEFLWIARSIDRVRLCRGPHGKPKPFRKDRGEARIKKKEWRKLNH
jgi:hypothetical protein